MTAPPSPGSPGDGDEPSGPDLEIFRHALESSVEEMGVTLQRTAYSTNIKIRRDHTCALFDADLRHVAQHDVAPQHIGSLVSVIPRNVEPLLDELEPGDGFLINDPYRGAVHLPDVMLVSPVFDDEDADDPELIGVAANSAHHVDVGGSTAGGIPISTDLYQEGLVFPMVRAAEDWAYDDRIMSLVTRNVRDSEKRMGDYRAQLGANRIGVRRLRSLREEYGPEGLDRHLDALLDYTERRVRAAIADLPDGTYGASDEMDGDGVTGDPVPIALSITVDGDEMTLDFSGTASTNEGPLNCTPAMAFAGVMSVVMGFVGSDLPKNDGFYRPFEVVTPEDTMVNPREGAPVAGGWEVAMRAGELVAKAMADAVPEETIAATKGIICNVAYGGRDPRDGEEYVFYETVAGGYGARAERDGMDAVQTHFQNTANSPIEELETEIPLRVRRYELIADSAGAGRTRGGLGVRRDVEFYDHEATFSLLSDRAESDPWGLFGGRPGRRARYVVNPDTDPRPVNSKSTTTLDPGDVTSVQTPGGGGYGDPHERDPEAVARDVRNGVVSVEAARGEYGVVCDAEGTVDRAATEALRGSAETEGDGPAGESEGDGTDPEGGDPA
ncbi:5-oxoprolinase [Halobacteriales archaeon QS_8_69_26]|nr:MAG: 5-oxoprolinase [Halobacteriales archaeon QS_8_69_26]